MNELPKTINSICDSLGITRSTFYKIVKNNNIHPVHTRGCNSPFYLQRDIAKAFYRKEK